MSDTPPHQPASHQPTPHQPGAYQVLARKYRPQTFADLIGQDAMVRTLRNAFATDRIAHAFMLTGVRGVGKTTTARIVAKGLNCIGEGGAGGPTTEPCGVCEPCRGITEGRFIDVLEIDAASSTGVDSMREINRLADGRPMAGRFKIFIIDEVHMLSTQAFNAMLKTLEEPRGHTKFIMATTEIRKVPVTVLSRCQRFDLKRIEPEAMMAHLARIAGLEGAAIAEGALALITRAAEGSVRDALSLMDQAIAHGPEDGSSGETGAAQVRDMLGMADRGRVLDLFDRIMAGDAAGALAELSGQYADGADPVAVLRDLAEVTHMISVLKVSPGAADDPTTPPDERARGLDMAARLPMRALTRQWQMLLKALEEVGLAPNAMMAAEMAVIRLTHVADLPDPETLVRRLQSGQPPAAQASGAPAGGATVHAPATRAQAPSGGGQGGAATARALAPDPLAHLSTFPQVVDLIRERRDMKLLVEVEDHLRLVRYAPGRIEFEPGPAAPRDLAARLAQRLQGWTGTRWGVSVTGGGGADTIAETRGAARSAAETGALDNPLVQAVLAAFPGAKVTAVREPEPVAPATAPDPVTLAGEADDPDWDPFEDD